MADGPRRRRASRITPLLATTLQWSGPESWRSFTLEQRNQTRLRHRRIAAVLKNLDEQATAHGLGILPLKGAALHALGVYAAGARPMADLDLLVRPADAGRAADLLQSLGYVETWAIWKHGCSNLRSPPNECVSGRPRLLHCRPGSTRSIPSR